VLYGGEQCFQCLGLGRVLREAGAAMEDSRIGLVTSAGDAGTVFDHLRREGLGQLPVFTFEDSA